MRTSRVALLLALAATVLPLRAASAGGPPAVVVRGDHASYVDVTFAHRFRPHVQSSVGDDTRLAPVTRTKGTYAAVWIESLDHRTAGRPLNMGTVSVPAMSVGLVPPGWGTTDRTSDWSLPAGRYRVHLATDGASEVRIPTGGLASDVVLRPAAPDRRVRGKVVALPVLAGEPAAWGETTVSVRPETMTVLVASVAAEWASAYRIEVCAQTGLAPCEEVAPYDQPGQTFTGGGVVPGERGGAWGGVYVYPHDPRMPAGDHAARFRVATDGLIRSAYGFALTITP
jgi:hypothetical protein